MMPRKPDATSEIADLEKKVAARPTDPTLRFTLGKAWIAAGEQARARKELRLALRGFRAYFEDDAESYEAWREIARIHAVLGDSERALKALKSFARCLGGRDPFKYVRGLSEFAVLKDDPSYRALVEPPTPVQLEARKAALSEKHEEVATRLGFTEGAAFKAELACCVARKFRLRAASKPKAHALVRDTLASWRGVHSEHWLKWLARAKSLEALFGAGSLVLDTKGNVIDIACGADEWPGVIALLGCVAPLVDAGSYLLLLDDRRRYWRLRIDERSLKIDKGRTAARFPPPTDPTAFF
jgi:tetratricopeptide (TPR) repeat protein